VSLTEACVGTEGILLAKLGPTLMKKLIKLISNICGIIHYLVIKTPA